MECEDSVGSYFNPRSPCGERPFGERNQLIVAIISIHAPRVGSDDSFIFLPPYIYYFNPRSPCGERPFPSFQTDCSSGFQSTLPVWGATLGVGTGFSASSYFNPRSPCGERQEIRSEASQQADFNPRSPCGERHTNPVIRYITHDFNPRSPCGERPGNGVDSSRTIQFQSTLPVWGATISCKMLFRC